MPVCVRVPDAVVPAWQYAVAVSFMPRRVDWRRDGNDGDVPRDGIRRGVEREYCRAQ